MRATGADKRVGYTPNNQNPYPILILRILVQNLVKPINQLTYAPRHPEHLVFAQHPLIEIDVQKVGGIEEVEYLFVVGFVNDVSNDGKKMGVRVVFPSTLLSNRLKGLRRRTPKLLRGLDQIASFKFNMSLIK